MERRGREYIAQYLLRTAQRVHRSPPVPSPQFGLGPHHPATCLRRHVEPQLRAVHLQKQRLRPGLALVNIHACSNATIHRLQCLCSLAWVLVVVVVVVEASVDVVQAALNVEVVEAALDGAHWERPWVLRVLAASVEVVEAAVDGAYWEQHWVLRVLWKCWEGHWVLRLLWV